MAATLESILKAAREKKDLGLIDRTIDAAVAAKQPDARALCLAILRTRLDAVKALLAAGTTGLEDTVDGLFSPLQLAATCKWYWSWLDPPEETSRTVCPQILACVFDKAEYGLPGDTASEGTVEMLEAACASRHPFDDDDWCLVLGNAAESELDAVAKIGSLLARKPPRAALDDAAKRAAEGGRLDTLGKLLAAGAAATPELTVRAARAGATAVVELLLARGVPLDAKVTLTDEEGTRERVTVRDEVEGLLPDLAKAPAARKSKKAEKDPVRPHAAFYAKTGTMLVFGRRVTLRDQSADQLLAFFDAVIALSDSEELRVVAADDFSRFKEIRSHGKHNVTWVVGYKVETALAESGAPSRAISPADLSAAAKKAAKVLTAAFWQQVQSVGGAAPADEQDGFVVVPFGPLSSGFLVWGAATTKREAPRGLKTVFGADMDQEPHATGVVGVVVANAADWDTARVTVDGAEQARRVAATKTLRAPAFHLVSRYD